MTRRVWEILALNLTPALPPGVSPAHLEWAAMLVRYALLQKLPQGIQAMLLYRSHVCGMRFMDKQLEVCWRASLAQEVAHERVHDALPRISGALWRDGNRALARAVDELADRTQAVHEDATGCRDASSVLRELGDDELTSVDLSLSLRQHQALGAVAAASAI
jgi:hypothetical protein